jgi:hypothetical protein
VSNRFRLAFALTSLIAVPAAGQTQTTGSAPAGTGVADARPSHVDASLFAATEHPSLFPDLKIRTTDMLEASLVVENGGGSITYAPLLYGLREYRQWASEVRFRVSQNSGNTTFNVGSQYNPLSPRSARGTELWAKGGGTEPANALRIKLEGRIRPHEEQLKTLRAEYAKKSRLPKNATPADLERIRKELEALADRIVTEQAALVPLKQEAAALDAQEKARTDTRVRDFYRGLLETYVPVVGVNYSATLFSVLGGTDVDADGDGLNDVEHRVKGHALTLSADSRLTERFQISGLLTTGWDRGSPEAGTEYARTYGAALTFGGIVYVLDDDYRTSSAYLESLFIPSVVLGGAIEYGRCDNPSDAGVVCPGRFRHQTALTPFVDLKVNRTLQFRVGTPIKFTRLVAGTKGTDLGIVTALSLQLGPPR